LKYVGMATAEDNLNRMLRAAWGCGEPNARIWIRPKLAVRRSTWRFLGDARWINWVRDWISHISRKKRL